MRRSTPRRVAAIVLAAALLVACRASVEVISDTDIQNRLVAFLTALRDSDEETAYDLLDQDTQGRVSFSEFRRQRDFVESEGQGLARWWDLTCSAVSSDRAGCRVVIESAAGDRVDATIQLNRQDHEWFVHLADPSESSST